METEVPAKCKNPEQSRWKTWLIMTSVAKKIKKGMKIIMIVKGIPDSFTIINIGLEAFHLFQHQHMCLHEEIPCRSDRGKSYQIEINPSAIFCSKYIF